MSKAQPLSKTRERQRNDKQRQGFSSAEDNQWEALCAFIEPIATAAADRAARDYLDQKDLVTKVYLNERLSSTEKLFDEKLKNTEANIVNQLRQEMGKQSTELRQEMGKQSTELRQEMGNGYDKLNNVYNDLRKDVNQIQVEIAKLNAAFGRKMFWGMSALAGFITLLTFLKPAAQAVAQAAGVPAP